MAHHALASGRRWTVGCGGSPASEGWTGILGEAARLLLLFECLDRGSLCHLPGTKARRANLLWPALSAGAILLERVTERRHSEPLAPFVEDCEDENAMLRQKEGTGPPDDLDPSRAWVRRKRISTALAGARFLGLFPISGQDRVNRDGTEDTQTLSL
jgi:hypothetical protein